MRNKENRNKEKFIFKNKNIFYTLALVIPLNDRCFLTKTTHEIFRLKHHTNDITSRDNFIDAKRLNNFIRYFRFHVELFHVFPRRIILFSIVSLIVERPA